MIHLILSLDYEIFGNGSGDVRRDMIEPTNRLLALCDKYGARVSIMFEVGEYWAINDAEVKGLLHLDYSPSQEIKEQVRYATKCGHDVQLHLHPWWIGARFKYGSWQLRPEYRRITDLPHGQGSQEDVFSIVGALHRGKRTMENMILPVYPEYECLVYRAAMFWGQPSEELILGMKRVGLVADSSVVKDLHETTPVPTDYRQAKPATGYWWTTANDISQSGRTGENIIEFPVHSKVRPYVCNFKWTKLRTTLKRRYVERGNTRGHAMVKARQSTESLGQMLKKLGTLQPLKYDFCKLSATDMIRGVRELLKEDCMDRNDFGTPVVMLGHSKDFWNDRNLEMFLRFIKKECESRVHFSTFRELAKRIAKRDKITN